VVVVGTEHQPDGVVGGQRRALVVAEGERCTLVLNRKAANHMLDTGREGVAVVAVLQLEKVNSGLDIMEAQIRFVLE